MTRAGADVLQAPRVHELVNARGDRVRLLDYGARVASIDLDLRAGRRRVTLGYTNATDYLSDRYFAGATIGRYANRLRDARFTLYGRSIQLVPNEGPNQLHGGPDGFDRRYWSVGGGSSSRQIEYCMHSPDGEAGYPGALRACVRFAWSDERELVINYAASTDRPTHVNMTNHTYFNLDGSQAGILGHRVRVQADSITDVDADLLPTGSLFDVTGTVLDLRQSALLANVVAAGDPRIARARGVDFNYVLTGDEPAATVTSSNGDLELQVRTTCPGMQLYSGQNLGAPFAPFRGLCLEAQYFPDSPNQPRFPSTLLITGQRYAETTAFRFIEH